MNGETGNSIWRLLHTFAASYPVIATEQQQADAVVFMHTFKQVVADRSHGCACRSEWEAILKRCPPDMRGRSELLIWTIAAHDWINQKLNRKLYQPEISLNHPIFTAV